MLVKGGELTKYVEGTFLKRPELYFDVHAVKLNPYRR